MIRKKIVQVKKEQVRLLRSLDTRWYVVAPNMEWFLEYVRQTGKELQACKPIVTVEGCHGVSFTSPLDELVVLEGWARGEARWFDEVHLLMARYCRDKRKHEVPRYDTGTRKRP